VSGALFPAETFDAITFVCFQDGNSAAFFSTPTLRPNMDTRQGAAEGRRDADAGVVLDGRRRTRRGGCRARRARLCAQVP